MLFRSIVFEGRNKSYGAYQLRQLYDRNMARGMMIGIAFFLACILSVIVLQKLEWNKHSTEVITTSCPVDLQNFPPPNLEKPKPVKSTPPPQLKTRIQFVEPKVIDDEDELVETPPPTQSDLTNTSSGTTTIKSDSGTVDPGLVEGPPDNGIIAAPITEDDPPPLPYVIVEQKPEFPGGMKGLRDYLQNNLKFNSSGMPDNARVRFIVDKEGFVKDVHVLSSSSIAFEKNVKQVIENMPKWKPGKHNGQPVKVAFILPVKTQLH